MKKNKKFYINANDYLTLAVILVMLCVILQFTVRLFFIDLLMFKIANVLCSILSLCGVAMLIFGIMAKIKGVTCESKEQALAIVQRFIRENEIKHDYDIAELLMALKYLCWLEEVGESNSSSAVETTEKVKEGVEVKITKGEEGNEKD